MWFVAPNPSAKPESMKTSLGLPLNFKNPFAEKDPDEVWKQLRKTPAPLTREEEDLLKKGKITLAEIRDKEKK
jgi:hypothetical protein